MSDHKPTKPHGDQARHAKDPHQGKDPHQDKDSHEEKHPRERRLDTELEDSFPASDPPSMTQPHARHGRPRRAPGKASERTKEHDRK